MESAKRAKARGSPATQPGATAAERMRIRGASSPCSGAVFAPPVVSTRIGALGPDTRKSTGQGQEGSPNTGTAPAFLELFRGHAGLSAAVAEICAGKVVDAARLDPRLAAVDLSNDDDFALILGVIALWIHGAPRCRTFSRARRHDQHASVKQLRTLDRPGGFGDAQTEEDNKLADRMAAVALQRLEQDQFSR